MPICADPNDTIRFVFKTDADKENPPTAHIRFRTAREDAKIPALNKAVTDAVAKDDEDAMGAALTAVFKFGIARLENYPPGWTLDNLESKLTGSECWELEGAIYNLPRLTEGERKNSVSSLTSNGEVAAIENTLNANPSASPAPAADAP
jgi:hypothetical protein